MLGTTVTLALLLLASPISAATAPPTVVLWPGYRVVLPAEHCIDLSRRVDFDLIYFHGVGDPDGPILVGIYAGHNPENLDCPKGDTKEWIANGLRFKSVRSNEGCAEFLIDDPATPERGYLHIWFGPAAKNDPKAAEAVISSVQPVPLPVYRPDDLPFCKQH